jgi:hypothetical protein
METTILNLPMEKSVVERIGKYARRRKTSVSQLAENYFNTITATQHHQKAKISPLVHSLSIDGIKAPPDFDYKAALAQTRNEKYL